MNNDPAPGSDGSSPIIDLWIDFASLFVSIFG
jgi:hypothetical protein